MIFKKIQDIISTIDTNTLPENRVDVLQVLVDYIQEKKNARQKIELNFICTHNSRRSQFSQVWAKVMSCHFGINIGSYSGGVEVTACNERTIASLQRSGFEINSVEQINPIYEIEFSDDKAPIIAFSKLFDDSNNPKEDFAAIMTCSHADENCPYVTGCDSRIPVRFEDPKAFDDTDLESKMYDERSLQIATELFYVFSQIK